MTAQILICNDGMEDWERAVDTAAALLGPRGLRGQRELAGGSVSHDVATHARRPVLIVLPPAP